MNITDELRKEARGFGRYVYTAPQADCLTAIADRIDAEHEAACAEAYGNGVMSVPIALDESAWVELPKDADGEYIHVGDAVTCGATVWTATGLKFLGEGWGICCTVYNEYGGSGTSVYPPSDLRHYQPPTVEDVLREFAERVCNSGHRWGGLDAADTIAEYAAKLRLAGDAE